MREVLGWPPNQRVFLLNTQHSLDEFGIPHSKNIFVYMIIQLCMYYIYAMLCICIYYTLYVCPKPQILSTSGLMLRHPVTLPREWRSNSWHGWENRWSCSNNWSRWQSDWYDNQGPGRLSAGLRLLWGLFRLCLVKFKRWMTSKNELLESQWTSALGLIMFPWPLFGFSEIRVPANCCWFVKKDTHTYYGP